MGLARCLPGEVVNVATGHLLRVRDFAEEAGRILGLPQSHLRFGGLPTRPEEMAHDPVALDRLCVMTGWVPTTSVEVGIRRALAVERQLAQAVD